jgi:DNA-binding NarL/FixJ family response regulator
MNNAQIAEEFGSKSKTVKARISIIALKMGIDSSIFHPRIRIVYLTALERGLINA